MTGAQWILLAAVLWSSGGLVIKLVPLGSTAVTAGRAMATVAFFHAAVRPSLRRANWLTALCYAGMIVSFVAATKRTTAAQAIVLQYTGTAWVILAAPRLLGERWLWRDLAVAAVALAAMAACAQDAAGGGQLTGNLLGVLSGCFYAGTVLTLRRAAAGAADQSPEASILAGNWLALLACLPFSAAELWHGIDWRSALGLGYLGVVQIGFAYWAFARGLRSVPAATATLLALAEPVLLPVWVFLGTGERPSTATVACGAVVVAALAVRAALQPKPD